MDGRPVLFYVTGSDAIVRDDYSARVVNDLTGHLTDMTKIIMTCYRAGGTVVELVIHCGDKSVFCLTIWEGELDVPPVSTDDIRVAHKEISLPDVTDIFILVTKLARYARLSPSFSTDPDSSSVLEFSS